MNGVPSYCNGLVAGLGPLAELRPMRNGEDTVPKHTWHRHGVRLWLGVYCAVEELCLLCVLGQIMLTLNTDSIVEVGTA